MRPVVIVEPIVRSTWGSCQTIMPNLVEAYRLFLGERLQNVDYGLHSTAYQVLESAKKIRALDPSHLVFVDHQKHPQELLAAIDFVYGDKAWPKIIVHVYGDFTLYTNSWDRCEEILQGRYVHFVCASPRQKGLISSFFKNGSKLTSVCHFPVSEDEYRHRGGLRKTERSRRGLRDEEFVLVYTGRLSLQKNILKLTETIAAMIAAGSKSWRLLLAGSFDDLGSPFFGISLRPQEYFEAFRAFLSAIPPDVQDRIEFLGALDKVELRSLYHASDLFISFSTHHDEDYGMSPIEALACGTPALISDWGGFSAFAIDRESVALMPIRIGGHGPMIELQSLATGLDRFEKKAKSETEFDRVQRSKLFLKAFGFESASRHLQNIIEQSGPKFSGFTPLLKRHSKLMMNIKRAGRIYKMASNPDPTYHAIYRHYLRETRST